VKNAEIEKLPPDRLDLPSLRHGAMYPLTTAPRARSLPGCCLDWSTIGYSCVSSAKYAIVCIGGFMSVRAADPKALVHAD
jgi:hypothetical protein